MESYPTPRWIAFLMLFRLVYNIRPDFNELILAWRAFGRSSFQSCVFPPLVSFLIVSYIFFDFIPIFKCHTQSMERINWISRFWTLCWIFWKKFIKKKSNIQEAYQTLKIVGVAISSHITFFSVFAGFWTLPDNSGKPKLVYLKQKN